MLTYVVDVRNVVFVNSNCLLNTKEFKISITKPLCHDTCIIINILQWFLTSASFMNSPIFVTLVKNLL